MLGARDARPLASLAAKQGNGQGSWGVGNTLHSNAFQPVALQVVKRGKLCTVAKLVLLDREPVVAIVHRHQHGVSKMISLPIVALNYAEQRGVSRLVFRRDTTGQAWTIALADLRTRGLLKTSDGLLELFISIDAMRQQGWPTWQYVEDAILLGEMPTEAATTQLSLEW